MAASHALVSATKGGGGVVVVVGTITAEARMWDEPMCRAAAAAAAASVDCAQRESMCDESLAQDTAGKGGGKAIAYPVNASMQPRMS